jgi:hypothetical protein
MLIERLPYVSEIVIFWMDDNTPAPALVTNVIADSMKDSGIGLRPFLNMTVFRPDDGKPWAKVNVPPVYEDGEVIHKAHRYSLMGEYDELLPQ